MSKNVSEPVDYIFQSVHTALLTRDFQYAEKLLNQTLKKRKNLTPEEHKIAEELRARVYMRANNLEKALESCLGLYNENPDDIETMNTLGVLYRQLYRFDESLAILNKAKEHAPENESVFYNLGKTYQEMKQYQKAVECFLAALELKPEDVSAYDLLGGLYAQLNDNHKAINSYRQGLQWDPNNPSLNFHLAQILQTEKRYEESVTYYKAALKTQPAWKEALQSIAPLYVLLNKFDEALKVYRSLLRISGKNAAVCTEIGALFERKQLPAEAEQYYREAVHIDSGYAPAVLALAAFLKKKGHTEEVLPILLKAQSDPKNTKNYPLQFQTVEACIAAGDYAKAQHILQNLESSAADTLTLLKLQGKLAALMGDTEHAEKIFEKIISIAPAEIEFRYELAEQYVKTGKYNEAKEQLMLFLNGKPNDITARLLLGKTEELLNNPKSAYKIYQKIIQDYPDSIDARAALSQLLHKHGNTLEALQTADEMVRLQSTGNTEDDIQGLADSLDLYEKAVENYIADPALTKNLDKLKVETDPEFVSSEELAEAAYQDELFPLFDENSILDNDVPLELFTEDTDSELTDEDQALLDAPPAEEAYDETEEIEDEIDLSAESTAEDFYGRFNIPQGVQSALPEESLVSGELTAAAEDSPLAAYQEPDSSADATDETSPILSHESPDIISTPLPAASESDTIPMPAAENNTRATAAIAEDPVMPAVSSKAEHTASASPVTQITPPHYENPIAADSSTVQTDAIPHEQTPAMSLYTTPYNTEMLDAAVQSLNSIVSHLNTSIEAVQKNNLADTIAEQVSSTILDKVHELSESHYKNTAAQENLQETAADIPSDHDSTPCKLPAAHDEADNTGSYALSDTDKENLQWCRNPHTVKNASDLDTYLDTIETETLAGMLMYLKDLFSFLPSQMLGAFLTSRQRIQMQYIISRLSGELGLKDRAELLQKKYGYTLPEPHAIDHTHIIGLLEYLHDLCVELPDEGLRTGCMRVLDQLLTDFWQTTEQMNI